MSSIAHQEIIHLKASADKVKQYIMTPERILDYYPSPIDAGIIEEGASLWCRGKSGVSLLEVVKSDSNENLVVVKVTTALNIKPPYTKDRIEAATFFTMLEDWALEETDAGTTLTKTWRDIKKKKLRLLPMGLIVRFSAKGESKKLQAAWNKSAEIS